MRRKLCAAPTWKRNANAPNASSSPSSRQATQQGLDAAVRWRWSLEKIHLWPEATTREQFEALHLDGGNGP